MRVTRIVLQITLVIISLFAFPQVGAASPLSVEVSQVVSPTGTDLQAGPLGLNPIVAGTDRAQLPVAILIPDAAVEAEVEQNRIVDGTMLDPSGPWVVSWYQGTSRLGEQGNSVMAGHLDYWGVGPAVFYDLAALGEDDEILVTGDTGDLFTFQVTWTRLYQLEELDTQTITDIVGPTTVASLTLITCGGEFDEATGQYLSRYVVRAELTSST